MKTRTKEEEKRLLFFYGNTRKPLGSLGARSATLASLAALRARVRAPRLPVSVVLTVFCTFL
jgi:hypothetical protein